MAARHARRQRRRGRFEFGGGTFSGTTWSIGPVAVSLPMFDAGARRANVVAARARYDEAASAYAATLRNAIRDVENALVTLQGTADRSADAQIAAENFEVSVRATEARYRSGFGTLFELEDARRSALARADHADRPAPRARRRLDRALPRARRRLVRATCDERTAADFGAAPPRRHDDRSSAGCSLSAARRPRRRDDGRSCSRCAHGRPTRRRRRRRPSRR